MSTVDTELRELDAEIAEKVMGWKHGHSHTYCDRPFVSCPVCLTRFSTDIAAAMSVVEKMRERGWKVSLMGEPNDDWWVVFSQGDDDPMAQSFMPSLPQAVAHAALTAIKSNK